MRLALLHLAVILKLRCSQSFCLEHCVESVQIRSFSSSYFPVFSPNTGNYIPKKTPYLDTFHTVEAKVPTFSSSILFILFYFSFLTLARKTYH